MSKQTIEKQTLKDYVADPLNFALLISAGVTTILCLCLGFGLILSSVIWIVVLYKCKYFRTKYNNHYWLMVFFLISVGLTQDNTQFMISNMVFFALMLIPEKKWNIFNK